MFKSLSNNTKNSTENFINHEKNIIFNFNNINNINQLNNQINDNNFQKLKFVICKHK